MSISYVQNIPNPTHTPANDVSNMQSNNNNAASIWNTDHVGFNTGSATVPSGSHNKLTFPSAQSNPGALGTQTIIYPKILNNYLELFIAACNGGASQILGYLPFVKCAGFYTGDATAPTGTPTQVPNSLNVNIASVSQDNSVPFTHTVTVTFTQALPNDTYFVLEDAALASVGGFLKTASTLTFNLQTGTQQFHFMVI